MRYLPPEWSAQDGVLLTWPHDGNEWQPSLAAVERVFVDIATACAERQAVVIVCRSDEHTAHVKHLLASANLSQCYFSQCPSTDVWARDHGPITIYEDQKPKLLDFTFNGWGNKYPSELDNQITTTIAQPAFKNTVIERHEFVLEGGSIEADGIGSLLTTTSCLLNQNRNPGWSKLDIEKYLSEQLGITQFHWLESGYLAGDDTDGHIDTLARFGHNNTLSYVNCTDKNDEHYTALNLMREQCTDFRNSHGSRYDLVALPWPEPVYNQDGLRLPATYANFLIINDAVLVPTYNDKNDAVAIEQIQHCFPNHEMIPINANPLIEQFGSIHCVTMQLPKGVLHS